MFLTMNRFKVVPDRVGEFEEIWKSRDSHLKTVPGFVSFALMKGPEAGDHVLYVSHTVWTEEAQFKAWTKSEAFRAAHAGARSSAGLYLGPPQLEVFEAIQVLEA